MSGIRHASASRPPVQAAAGLAIVAALLAVSAPHAAQLGHSRLVSQAGQPLHIEIPVADLSATEADTLHAEPARATAWQDAGLTPPVPLDSLDIQLVPGPAGAGHVLQVSSAEVFNQPVADLLLDVRSAAGEQRYQVSLLAQTDSAVVRTPAATPASGVQRRPAAGAGASVAASSASAVTVRPGDTMFAIAQRHAVAGISEYQLMMALLRANPQAFIDDNVNLVRAGATLAMPDSEALSALSDRAARRLFHQHVVAFEQGRRVDDVIDDDPQAIDTGEGAARQDTSGPAPQPDEAAEADASTPDDTDVDTTDDALIDSRPPSEDASESAEADNAPAADDAAVPDGSVPLDEPQTTDKSAGPSAATEPTAPAQTQDQLRLSSAPAPHQAEAAGSRSSTETVSGDAGAAPVPDAPVDIAGVQSHAEVQEGGSGSLGVMSEANAAETPESEAQRSGADVDNGSSSTDMPAGGTDDDRVAESKAIADAQERVSQLEENVKNLNRALQSQGEAAKDLVLDGAQELRQSLSDVATAVSEATKGDEEEEGETPAEQGQASSDEASEEARVGDDAPPATAEPAEVDPGASEVREPSTPETPTMASTAEDRDTDSSTPSAATPSDKADASDQKDAADASEKSSPSALSPAPAAVQSLEPQGLGGWLWKHIYAVLAVGLGLVVALMAWMFWLASRRQANQASAITPEMVQEKLDQINLDLNPPTGGNGPRSS